MNNEIKIREEFKREEINKAFAWLSCTIGGAVVMIAGISHTTLYTPEGVKILDPVSLCVCLVLGVVMIYCGFYFFIDKITDL